MYIYIYISRIHDTSYTIQNTEYLCLYMYICTEIDVHIHVDVDVEVEVEVDMDIDTFIHTDPYIDIHIDVS